MLLYLLHAVHAVGTKGHKKEIKFMPQNAVIIILSLQLISIIYARCNDGVRYLL